MLFSGIQIHPFPQIIWDRRKYTAITFVVISLQQQQAHHCQEL